MGGIKRICAKMISMLICYYHWILILLAVFQDVDSQISLHKRKSAKVDGDIIIGALFPVHKQPSMKVAFTRQCGPIWEQYGIHRIEIFLKTLDEINRNSHILPNVTLGCDIRDSCWYPPVALERSIDFIKNSIASLEAATSKTDKTGRDSNCANKRDKPIAGLIGPGSSTVTVQVQNLLSLFNIPQIGYSATTQDLSDKSLYNFFLRVVPSDKLQARALLDIVLHYNWTYVSTVYTEGNYGSSGIQEFQEMAKEAGICEASTDKVTNNAGDEAYDRVIETLKEKSRARVVVCFCEGMTIRGLLKATERKNAKGQFLFVGSDGWNVRPDVVEDIEDLAAGGISIKLYSPDIHDFDDYFFALNPFNNTRNPWFAEFWQQKFGCYIEGDSKLSQYKAPCTGNESLESDYIPDAKLGFVVNAIYTMAYALDSMQHDLCGDVPGLCDAMLPVNGTTFLKYLFNVSFLSYSNDMINFNENGDPPGRYDIMNFQPIKTENGSLVYDYVRVGGWDQGNLTMNSSNVFWPTPGANKGSRTAPVESICSKPCPHGQVKKLNDGGIKCCWVCTPCKENEILLDDSTCKACQQGWRPNEELNACLMIEKEFIQWGDTEAIVAMVFACTGIFVTGWVALVFIRHNNTPVVKASTRELSYIILVGICISFLTSFPLVAKPSLVTCYLVRILPGFSFSLIYGALVTKTNRIARILAGSKKKIMTRKPRFMSASAQVVITCIIIGIECAIITAMLILEPADSTLIYPTKTRVKLACNATTLGIIVPLGFDIFLIVMCTLYAIKTRNLPENFNEAKFIGFTMYTTCVIWCAFVPIYFGSDNKVITMCLAIALSASVALILLFFPKLYIIVCKPEKNNRSAFTTSKDVRCHIGSTSRSYHSVDSMDRGSASNIYQWRVQQGPGPKIVCEKQMEVIWNEKSFEHAALTIYRQRNFFDRWRQKSISGNEKEVGVVSSGGSQSYGKVPTSVPPFRSSSNDSMCMSSPQETSGNTAITRIVEPRRRIRAPAPFADFRDDMETEFEIMDNAIDHHDVDAFAVGNSSHRSRKVETIENYVQTGDELLESLLIGLRKRKVSRDSQVSSGSNTFSSVLLVKNNNGFTEDNESQLKSISKETHNNSYNHGANEHLMPKCCASSNSSQDVTDSSPLLKNSILECDSTSEETLSERDPFPDIDDLLMDIEPHKGSFGTLKGSKSSKLSLTDTGETAVLCGTPPISPKTKDQVNASPPGQDKKSNPCNNSNKNTHNNPTEFFGDNSWAGPLSKQIAIPRILVERASQSSSDYSPVSQDSGRPSDPDSRRPSFLSNCDKSADRTSAELSSIEDFSMYSINRSDSSSTEHSVFDRPGSSKNQPKKDSVTEFQEYLKTKGLQLDMNSVQSSEV